MEGSFTRATTREIVGRSVIVMRPVSVLIAGWTVMTRPTGTVRGVLEKTGVPDTGRQPC